MGIPVAAPLDHPFTEVILHMGQNRLLQGLEILDFVLFVVSDIISGGGAMSTRLIIGSLVIKL